MSRILESESDNDESGQSSLANSGSADVANVGRDNSSDANSNVIQRRLEQFSRRLSMLGLMSSQEIEEKDGEEQPDVIETQGLAPLRQEVPMTASLILNKLPKATNEALEKSQQASSKKSHQDKQLKVQIKFQPIGSIAQITPSVCKISATQPFALISTFLTRSLKVSQVYCYINNSFAPNPQQIVGDLWSQFKVDNELIVSYCGTVAFG